MRTHHFRKLARTFVPCPTLRPMSLGKRILIHYHHHRFVPHTSRETLTDHFHPHKEIYIVESVHSPNIHSSIPAAGVFCVGVWGVNSREEPQVYKRNILRMLWNDLYEIESENNMRNFIVIHPNNHTKVYHKQRGWRTAARGVHRQAGIRQRTAEKVFLLFSERIPEMIILVPCNILCDCV